MSKEIPEEKAISDVSEVERNYERELIEDAREGDKYAFGKLIMLHQKKLLRTVLLLTGSRDTALDIVQDAFIRAWNALNAFDLDRPFYPWIATIARFLALNYIKRESRGKSLDDEQNAKIEIVDSAAGPLDKLIEKETDRKFAAALRALPEQFRTVFVLRMYEDMSYDQIAKTLNISAGTVDSRIHRAREKLVELLKDELG